MKIYFYDFLSGMIIRIITNKISTTGIKATMIQNKLQLRNMRRLTKQLIAIKTKILVPIRDTKAPIGLTITNSVKQMAKKIA